MLRRGQMQPAPVNPHIVAGFCQHIFIAPAAENTPRVLPELHALITGVHRRFRSDIQIYQHLMFFSVPAFYLVGNVGDRTAHQLQITQ